MNYTTLKKSIPTRDGGIVQEGTIVGVSDDALDVLGNVQIFRLDDPQCHDGKWVRADALALPQVSEIRLARI